MIAFIIMCMGLVLKVCVGLVFWGAILFVVMWVLFFAAQFYYFKRNGDGNN